MRWNLHTKDHVDSTSVRAALEAAREHYLETADGAPWLASFKVKEKALEAAAVACREDVSAQMEAAILGVEAAMTAGKFAHVSILGDTHPPDSVDGVVSRIAIHVDYYA